MSSEALDGNIVPFKKENFFSGKIGSLRSQFEVAVAAKIGATAYFLLITPRTLRLADEGDCPISSPVPIEKGRLSSACGCFGFQNLDAELKRKGYSAVLRPIGGQNPYLEMALIRRG